MADAHIDEKKNASVRKLNQLTTGAFSPEEIE
jgi:hypothetical protein